MSVAAGLPAAQCTDWRVRAGVTAASAVAFIGFAGVGAGAVTGEPTLWSYTPLIALAAVLGCGYRIIAHATAPTVAGITDGWAQQPDLSE